MALAVALAVGLGGPAARAQLLFGDGLKKATTTRALMNARQIGMALLEFESNFGAYPSAETAEKVKKEFLKDVATKPVTSNEYLYQLVAAKVIENPDIFTWEKPGDAKPGEAAWGRLARCGYAYVTGMSTEGSPSRPLLIAPMAKDGPGYDPKPFDGKVVVLMVDCSVRALPIEKDGRVLIDGKDLLDPDQEYWGGKAPQIAKPAK